MLRSVDSGPRGSGASELKLPLLVGQITPQPIEEAIAGLLDTLRD